jgi:hypothetical protein
MLVGMCTVIYIIGALISFCFIALIEHTCNYYDTTYFIKKKEEKKRFYNVLMYCMLLHVNEQVFFSYIKAMKQKEIKAPIIYITVHIPTQIKLVIKVLFMVHSHLSNFLKNR